MASHTQRAMRSSEGCGCWLTVSKEMGNSVPQKELGKKELNSANHQEGVSSSESPDLWPPITVSLALGNAEQKKSKSHCKLLTYIPGRK